MRTIFQHFCVAFLGGIAIFATQTAHSVEKPKGPSKGVSETPNEYAKRMNEERILPLRAQLDFYREKYGVGHPQEKHVLTSITKMEGSIKLLRDSENDSNWQPKNISSMNEAELRSLIDVLVERVVTLELDVKSLKEAKTP